MTEIVFFFELHQPRRMRRQFGRMLPSSMDKLEELYFDDYLNKEVFERVTQKCYLPALRSILQSAREANFRCALGLSGLFVEQCNWWGEEVLGLIRDLVDTGSCELTSQTYYHSLASMISPQEFKEQIEEHKKMLKDLFNVTPTAAENTEFIYNNDVAKIMEGMGYKVMLSEGVERVLGWRSPNYMYKAKNANISVLMRNYRLSDDIGFRFTSRDWPEWPLTAEKYAGWLSKVTGDLIFLALDFETFGEHHWPESGIHDFLSRLPVEIGTHRSLKFATPSEAAASVKPVDEVDVKDSTSWADMERDTSAWLMNEMQRHCFDLVRYLEPMAKSSGEKYLRLWRLFTTSDNFHYMSTKGGGAGAVHSYFSPYNSPIESFLTFTWILADYRYRVYTALGDRSKYFRMLYGDLPESHSFHFYTGFAKPTGIMARNLSELREVARTVDIDSLEFHVRRGDLSRWSREVLGCAGLSEALERMKSMPSDMLRNLVVSEIDVEIKDAKRCLFGEGDEEKEGEDTEAKAGKT